MDFVKHMDSAAIAFFERRCHWFQRCTGKTNYWLAGKWELVMAYTIAIGMMAHFAGIKDSSWLRLTGAIFDGTMIDWILSVYLILAGILESALLWKIREEIAFDRLRNGLANPRKIAGVFRYIRYGWVFFLVFSPHLFTIACFMSAWLLTCDPLPPQESKIKEFLHSFHFSKPEFATVEKCN